MITIHMHDDDTRFAEIATEILLGLCSLADSPDATIDDEDDMLGDIRIMLERMTPPERADLEPAIRRIITALGTKRAL